MAVALGRACRGSRSFVSRRAEPHTRLSSASAHSGRLMATLPNAAASGGIAPPTMLARL
ncbi:MAG: hypothetical protein ACRDRS_20410 [Pseudonocardiaceae bacterium]